MSRFCGEPSLDEVLSEPIIHALMKADGTDVSETCDILLRARRGAAAAGGGACDRTHAVGFGPRV